MVMQFTVKVSHYRYTAYHQNLKQVAWKTTGNSTGNFT